MTLTFAETHNMVAYLSKSDASEGFNQIIDFLNGSSIKLEALVDKKKVVITKATIRDALRLDDAEGCMSAKRTSWNEFSSTMASAIICLSSGRKFNFSKYIFDSLVQPQSPQPQPPPTHDVRIPMNLLQEVMNTCKALTRRVEHLELDKIDQALEITKLKRRVKKLERRNKVKVLKLKRLQKVGTGQRIETSDDTVMDDVSNQERIIAEMDQDANVVLEAKEVVDDTKAGQDAKVNESVNIQGRQEESQTEIYKIDLDHANKFLSMQEEESEPAELQEVVDVVTTAKLITEVVIAASTTISAVEVPVPVASTTAAPKLIVAPSRRTKGVVIRDPEESTTTTFTIIHTEAKSKDKRKGILVEEPKPLKKQDKEDPAVKRYQALKRKPQTEAQARKNMMIYLKNVASFKMDYFKGMSYDDVRPIFEVKFNTNMVFLQKTKEQIEEEESRALKRINETPAKKAAKRQKLDEEVEELKRHFQIVPNEDGDVYTEATHLARKVPVVSYEIMNNKPYYKIIRAGGTHQLYISFLTLLRNFDREDLKALWSFVKEKFATTKPKNFSDDFLLIILGAMFEKPDIHAQIKKNQRSVHGPAKVKERKYPLTRFTLDQMLNVVRLEVEEESEVSLELLSFGADAAKEFREKHAKCLMMLVKDLVLSSQDDAID
nr:hypothetical protein [Tanacetum cinerariifolium]